MIWSMSARIAFLVDDLEVHTGPGDADRLYAAECIKRRYPCCLVALHDRHARRIERIDSSDGIPHLRLPRNVPWRERQSHLGSFLDHFSPTVLSLRFIAYAYQRQGVVWRLGSFLAPFFRGCTTNIKVDELWIGKYCQAPFTDKLIGAVQKHFTLKFFSRVHPDIIHTNSFPHLAVLKHHGFYAKYLPLIGNIPIDNKNADPWLFPWLHERGIYISQSNRNDYWLFGFFGSIHLRQVTPSLPHVVSFLKILKEIARVHCRRIILISIGNSHGIPRNWGELQWYEQTKRLTPKIPFFTLGMRSVTEVSQFLKSVDFGLTTHPYVQIEKSGTVAAMLEHGLPVIAIRDDIRLPYEGALPQVDPSLVLTAGPELVHAIGSLTRKQPKSRLGDCVNQFLIDMSLSPLGGLEL